MTMTVSLITEMAENFRQKCLLVSSKQLFVIQELAELIGLLIASFPAVKYAQLCYRQLEIEKAQALKRNYGNLGAETCISNRARDDMLWWANNVASSCKPISPGKPDVHLTTDASRLGWGVILNGQTTGGRWSAQESTFHLTIWRSKHVC